MMMGTEVEGRRESFDCKKTQMPPNECFPKQQQRMLAVRMDGVDFSQGPSLCGRRSEVCVRVVKNGTELESGKVEEARSGHRP